MLVLLMMTVAKGTMELMMIVLMKMKIMMMITMMEKIMMKMMRMTALVLQHQAQLLQQQLLLLPPLLLKDQLIIIIVILIRNMNMNYLKKLKNLLKKATGNVLLRYILFFVLFYMYRISQNY